MKVWGPAREYGFDLKREAGNIKGGWYKVESGPLWVWQASLLVDSELGKVVSHSLP